MKKLKTLLVLSGLTISLLAGCNLNNESKNPSSDSGSSLVKTLASIKISAEPTKKTYYPGEEFDPAGLEVKAVYSTQEEEVVPASDYQLSGFDSQTAGPKTITVTYQEKTATFEVNVLGYDGLEITKPNKVNYFVGEDYDGTGLQVALKFSDGSTKPVAADKVTVDSSAFDKTKAGEYAIKVTANGQQGEFKVNVYETDWSAEEKAFLTAGIEDSNNPGLLYEFPYYMGFELNLGGIEKPAEDENAPAQAVRFNAPEGQDGQDGEDAGDEDEGPEYLVNWFEARTPFAVSEDDLEDYCDGIESIYRLDEEGQPVMEPVLDEEGQPVIDEATGEPVTEPVKAWSSYVFPGTYKTITDDADKLGFADDSEIYQYCRWYKDTDGYPIYQVLSIGLDENGSLLVVTTLAFLPYAGFAIDGQAYKTIGTDSETGEQFDMVEELAGIADYRGQISFDTTSIASFTDAILFPDYDENGVVFYSSNSYYNPYLYCNFYGARMFDAASCTFELRDKTAAYTNNDLQEILDTYRTFGYEVKLNEQYTIPVYDVAMEYDGYDYTISYYLASGDICIEVAVNDWEMPFEANHYLTVVADEISDVAEKYKLNFIEAQGGIDYDYETNEAYDYFVLGYASNTSTGFLTGITQNDEFLVWQGIYNSGLLSQEEFLALYQKGFGSKKGGYYGAATVGEGDDALTVQYQTNAAGTSFQFTAGGNRYTASFNATDTALTVNVTPSEGDKYAVNFTSENFTAAAGENNKPFAGTWKNDQLTLVLDNSGIVITQEILTFTAAPDGVHEMVFTFDLNVYGKYKYCDITIYQQYRVVDDAALVKAFFAGMLASYLEVENLDMFPDFASESATGYRISDAYFDDSEDYNELDILVYFETAEEAAAAVDPYNAALVAAKFVLDEDSGFYTSPNGQYKVRAANYGEKVVWLEFIFVQPTYWPAEDLVAYFAENQLTDPLPAYENGSGYDSFEYFGSFVIEFNSADENIVATYCQALVDAHFTLNEEESEVDDGYFVYDSPNKQYSVGVSEGWTTDIQIVITPAA